MGLGYAATSLDSPLDFRQVFSLIMLCFLPDNDDLSTPPHGVRACEKHLKMQHGALGLCAGSPLVFGVSGVEHYLASSCRLVV